MRQHQAEMATSPGDSFAWTDDATCNSRNSFFAGLFGALLVQVDVERQKKAALCGAAIFVSS